MERYTGKLHSGLMMGLAFIFGICVLVCGAATAQAQEAWDGTSARVYTGGDGTEGSPYEISSAAELAYLAKMVNAGEPYEDTYFILTEDIDLNRKSWTAIGTSMTEFHGYLDGGGHVVSNLYIKKKTKGQGLFAYTVDAQISNLTLSGVDIQGKNYVGGVCGIAENTTFFNCSVSGELRGENYVGGICGTEKQGTDQEGAALKLVRGCVNKARVTGTQYVGGISGSYKGCIYNSNNYGDVFGMQRSGGITGQGAADTCVNHGTVGGVQDVGGICGYVPTGQTVSSCVNMGSIQASIEVGGICGYVPGGTVILQSSNYGSVSGKERVGGINGVGGFSLCFNMGTVTGTQYVGGISGYIYGGVSGNGYNRGKVNGGAKGKYIGGIAGYMQASDGGAVLHFCYSTGKLTGKTNVGGIVGYNGGTVSDTFYLVNQAKIGIGGGKKGSARPKEASALKSVKMLTLLNEDEKIWKQSEGSYPKLAKAKSASSGNLSTAKKVEAVNTFTAKAGNRAVTLSWTPSMRVTGYEIEQYDKAKKAYVSVKTLSSVTLTNDTDYFIDICTIGRLKSKTTYKFRIRAYKEISGKKYYGKYKKVSVKTK